MLISSYLFFWSFSGKLIIYLIGTTLLTHHICIWMDTMDKRDKRKKRVLQLGIFLLLGTILCLKYRNFFFGNISHLAEAFHIDWSYRDQIIFLPIGISFYTLSAIGYMADVYWGKVKAEYSLVKTALFLGFFPVIVEGPICRWEDVEDTLFKNESIKAENIFQGGYRIIWGLFKKIVIADRLAMLVDKVYVGYESYSGVVIMTAAISYTIQLYMEFSGCMDIVIGSGQLFGIHLPENFRQPFFAKTCTDFWKRWHITLGVWFKNYIFYPVSISKIARKWNKFTRKHPGGNIGKYIARMGIAAMALFPVWISNGLWHGPRWSYIFYGLYYFGLIFTGLALEPIRDKILAVFHINPDWKGYKAFQSVKMLVIIFTGEMFFRAEGFRQGVHMFKSIFQGFRAEVFRDGTLLTLGLDRNDFQIIIIGCVIVFAADLLKEYWPQDCNEKICENEKACEENSNVLQERKMYRKKWFHVAEKVFVPGKWVVCYGLVMAILIFGAYGEGYQIIDLIYAGF